MNDVERPCYEKEKGGGEKDSYLRRKAWGNRDSALSSSCFSWEHLRAPGGEEEVSLATGAACCFLFFSFLPPSLPFIDFCSAFWHEILSRWRAFSTLSRHKHSDDTYKPTPSLPRKREHTYTDRDSHVYERRRIDRGIELSDQSYGSPFQWEGKEKEEENDCNGLSTWGGDVRASRWNENPRQEKEDLDLAPSNI